MIFLQKSHVSYNKTQNLFSISYDKFDLKIYNNQGSPNFVHKLIEANNKQTPNWQHHKAIDIVLTKKVEAYEPINTF